MPPHNSERQPAVPLDDPSLLFEAQSPLIRQYRDIFDRAFAENILPEQEGPFLPSDAPLYVKDRGSLRNSTSEQASTSKPQSPSPEMVFTTDSGPTETYEEIIDKLFWDS